MKPFKFIFSSFLVAASISANAFIISDVEEFNSALVSGEGIGFRFNLADHGYNQLTDEITNVKLSFNFREIVETEENLDDISQIDEWEFVIFYSYIFDGRDVFDDIDTGTVTFELNRNRTDECQFTDFNDGDPTCVQNLDMDGVMTSSLVPYTNNLWLGEVRLDAEVTRTSVPEPGAMLLLCLGLIGLGLGRYRVKR